MTQLLEKIKLALDPYILLELLDLEFDELVDYLKDAIEDSADVFEEYFTNEDDEDN